MVEDLILQLGKCILQRKFGSIPAVILVNVDRLVSSVLVAVDFERYFGFVSGAIDRATGGAVFVDLCPADGDPEARVVLRS